MSEIIPLNRNEVPFSPPEKIIESSKRGLFDLNRYPDLQDLITLKRLLAAYLNMDEENVFLGSGSDSLIMQIIYLFSRKGKIVSVDPTFSYANRLIRSLETKLLTIKLYEPYSLLPIEKLINQLRDADLIFIDNPNNPTGSLLLDRDSIDFLCKGVDGVIVIDEAYYEFSHFSVVDMVQENTNLVVIRTMSKAFGLAGLRVGYMIAGEPISKKISDQALPFTLSKPSIYAAMEALKDSNYMNEQVRFIIEERERVKAEMIKIGMKVYPSSTNFLLIYTNIPSIPKKLKEYGILVTDLSYQMPSGFIRVTIGTKEENNVLIHSLNKIIESNRTPSIS